jgi:hypothetical protein
MTLLLYYALLLAWLPLLWPALRSRGGARRWLLLVAAAGAASAAYEIWRTFWAPAAIRLDIYLLSIVLGCLYASAAVVLMRARRRKAAVVLGLVVVLAGAGMIFQWIVVGREGERMMAKFHAGNALLFAARFRDRDTYERLFGPFAAPQAPHPVGHWVALGETYYSRLIVNAEGQAWAFFHCGQNECVFAPAGTGMRLEDGAWETAVKPRLGPHTTVRLKVEADGGLTLLGGGSTRFAKVPPPIDPSPAPHALASLGTFASAVCQGQHARVRQVWLWRKGDRVEAFGIFDTLLAGEQAHFIRVAEMGAGAGGGNAWRFEWGGAWSASIVLEESGVTLDLKRPGLELERVRLTPGALIRDEAVDLAPLTAWADWEHWFDMVLVAHFASADVPAC